MKNQAVVRVAYFDLLNIISCFSVVILHCNGYVHTLNHVGAWGVRVFYEVVFYFAVPVFFMLSGATLLDYRAKYDTKAYFTKRLRRTFLPFVIFSILFSAISWMQTMRAGGSLPNLNGVMGSILMTKVPGTVYWFFIPLFLLYLVFPILSLAVERMSDKMMFYTCGLLAGFEVLLPFVFTFAPPQCSLDKSSTDRWLFGLFALGLCSLAWAYPDKRQVVGANDCYLILLHGI